MIKVFNYDCSELGFSNNFEFESLREEKAYHVCKENNVPFILIRNEELENDSYMLSAMVSGELSMYYEIFAENLKGESLKKIKEYNENVGRSIGFNMERKTRGYTEDELVSICERFANKNGICVAIISDFEKVYH